MRGEPSRLKRFWLWIQTPKALLLLFILLQTLNAFTPFVWTKITEHKFCETVQSIAHPPPEATPSTPYTIHQEEIYRRLEQRLYC